MEAEVDPSPAAGPAAGVRWNLADLYPEPADDAIERDLAAAEAAALRFAAAHRGRVAALDAPALARAVDELEALLDGPARAGAYAGLRFAADTATPANGARLQRVQERGSAVHNAVVFFELEWVALADEDAARLLADPALAHRRHLLESMRRYRPHVLSEPEEKLLEELANTGERAFARLFDETLAAARFPVRERGEVRECSEEEVLSLLYDADRERRCAAAAALTEGLKQHARILAFVFNTLVQTKATEDRLRAYPDPMAARHLANEIDARSVDALLAACERAHPLVQRYYGLKRRLLGLDELLDYDRYAPVGEPRGAVGWVESKRLVLDAYRDFSPELAEIAGRFFERAWIDAELRPGKRGGAFSASTVP